MNKGTVLMVTLWILAILSLLAIGIGFRATIDLRLVGYRIDSLKAYEIAKAGVIYAINEIANDKSNDTDTLWECGITLGPDETFDGKFRNIKMGEGHFDVTSIEDQERKININRAPRPVLMNLLSGAANAGELADNIKAWRGPLPNEEAPSISAKDYSGKDYACKGAPFDVIAELLLVKDIMPEIYYGQDLANGLANLATVYGPEEFKVNINTIDETSLAAVLASVELDRGVAASIVEYRAGIDKDINNTLDNMVFKNFSEVESFFGEAEGGGKDPKLVNLMPLVVFGSQYFKICSVGSLEGRKSGIKKMITCVVGRETGQNPPHKTEIIGWFEE